MKSKAHKSIRRHKGEKVRGVRGQLWADGAVGLAERGGKEMETDRGQDADRHHACSAGTDAQGQKGAPQTSIPLGKSLQCPYCQDGQEPGPVNHGCLCQVRVRPSTPLPSLTSQVTLSGWTSRAAIFPADSTGVAAAFTETRVLK